MVDLLLRSLCSSTRRSLSSSPFKSSLLLLQRISGLNRHFSAAAAAAPDSSAALGRSFDPTRLRNVEVIVCSDYGKTKIRIGTIKWQCDADFPHERALDNISFEREPGITISSKVDRVVSMVKGAGPVAQTNLVLTKTLKYDPSSVSEEGCDEVESLVVLDLFKKGGAVDNLRLQGVEHSRNTSTNSD